MQLEDEQLLLIQSLLEPPPTPPERQDFTRILPHFLCLKIFSLLDPQSLCRAAQVNIASSSSCTKILVVLDPQSLCRAVQVSIASSSSCTKNTSSTNHCSTHSLCAELLR